MQEIKQSVLDAGSVGAVHLYCFHQLNYLWQVFLARVPDLVLLRKVDTFNTAEELLVCIVACFVCQLPEEVAYPHGSLLLHLEHFSFDGFPSATHTFIMP